MTIKILFLAASPVGTSERNIGKEMREIVEKIRASGHRDLIEVEQAWAVRPDDLQQALLQHKPHIVHFSGHGTASDELILQDQNDNPKPVSKEALAFLFKVLKDNVQVVVLNACFSQPQAEAITQHIPCAIGMSKAIGDQAAITFAASFYRGIAYGRTIQEAFDLGVNSLQLEGIPGEHTPQLVLGANVNASELKPVNFVAPPLSERQPAEGPIRPAVIVPVPPPTPHNERRNKFAEWLTQNRRTVTRTSATLLAFLLLLSGTIGWVEYRVQCTTINEVFEKFNGRRKAMLEDPSALRLFRFFHDQYQSHTQQQVWSNSDLQFPDTGEGITRNTLEMENRKLLKHITVFAPQKLTLDNNGMTQFWIRSAEKRRRLHDWLENIRKIDTIAKECQEISAEYAAKQTSASEIDRVKSQQRLNYALYNYWNLIVNDMSTSNRSIERDIPWSWFSSGCQ